MNHDEWHTLLVVLLIINVLATLATLALVARHDQATRSHPHVR